MDVALVMSAAEAKAFFPASVREQFPPQLRLVSAEAVADFRSAASREALAGVEAVFTAWSTPQLQAEDLAALPRLRHVHHCGGTVKTVVAQPCWELGLQVTTAAEANAVPVAEYTLAMIVLANKGILPPRTNPASGGTGNYRQRVGIIGASRIGRHLMRLLQPFDLEVLIADPTLSAEAASGLGARLVTLEELCAQSQIISLHAPSLPSTRGMITRELLESMPSGATFINTSRGELVDQQALVQVLEGGELYAILDVTTPWALPAESALLSLPTVFLTPHIAGSKGAELQRLALSAVQEAGRAALGQELQHEVLLRDLDRMA